VSFHAYIVSRAPIRQAILSSGSLYLSPPQLAESGSALIRKVSRELEKLGYSDMATPSADALIEAQEALNIRYIWL
jgi:hypothetical protein